MRLLILNIAGITLVATPLFLLSATRSRVKWVDEHHDALSVVVWLVALVVLYLWFMPQFGLRPNPEFFRQ